MGKSSRLASAPCLSERSYCIIPDSEAFDLAPIRRQAKRRFELRPRPQGLNARREPGAIASLYRHPFPHGISCARERFQGLRDGFHDCRRSPRKSER
jgi:hypothetical protein